MVELLMNTETILTSNPTPLFSVLHHPPFYLLSPFYTPHQHHSFARDFIRRVDREKRKTNDRRISEHYFESRPLLPDVTAANLRRALMEDLGTGNVQIQRSLPDRSGGYTWTIQFLEKDGTNVPSLIGVGTDLIGNGVGVRVTTTSEPTMQLKGGAYIWTRNTDARPEAQLPDGESMESSSPVWYEQAVLFPEASQKADMFGMRGLALSGKLAVVGVSIPQEERCHLGWCHGWWCHGWWEVVVPWVVGGGGAMGGGRWLMGVVVLWLMGVVVLWL